MSKLTTKLERLKDFDKIYFYSFMDKAVFDDDDFKIYFMRNKFIFKINQLFKAAYNVKNINVLENFLTFLINEEKEWVDLKIDDGYFVYNLIDEYLKKTIEDNSTDINIFLMDFIAKNYNENIKEEAQNKLMDYELGLLEKPSIYYQINDTVIFGTYIQTKNLERKPIEWYIIDRDNKTLTLFSKYGLDNKIYSKIKKAGSWKESYIREWLNDEFYNNAFSSFEKTGINDIITKEKQGDDENSPELILYDKVSLLDCEDVSKLTKEQKTKATTEYTETKLKGSKSFYNPDKCFWWVKTTRRKSRYKTSQDAINKSGRFDHHNCDFTGASICPTITVNVNTLRKDEVNLKVVNEKRIDKSKGIPDGMNNIHIRNEKVCVISKARREQIEKEIQSKGGVIMPIDDDTTYIIVDSSFSIPTLNNWALATKNEENNKSHVIPYELYKLFTGETDEIAFRKKENEILYFMSRHYLINNSCYKGNEKYNNVVIRFLSDIKHMLKYIGSMNDLIFLKYYLEYLDRLDMLKFKENDITNEINCDFFKLIISNNLSLTLNVKNFINEYLRNNHIAVFYSINDVEPPSLIKYIRWSKEKEFEIKNYMTNISAYALADIFKYIRMNNDDFSKYLNEYFTDNLNQMIKAISKVEEKECIRKKSVIGYDIQYEKKQIIYYLIQNNHFEKLNYSELEERLIHSALKFFIANRIDAPDNFKKFIFDNPYKILRHINNDYDNGVIDWFDNNFDREEISDKNIESWLEYTINYVAYKYGKPNIKYTKFIKALNKQYVIYYEYLIYNTNRKIDFLRYLYKIDNRSHKFNFEEYGTKEIRTILKSYVQLFKMYPKDFRKQLDSYFIKNMSNILKNCIDKSEYYDFNAANYAFYLSFIDELIKAKDKVECSRILETVNSLEVEKVDSKKSLINELKKVFSEEEFKNAIIGY